MKRLAFLILLVGAGCSHKPCATTSECGNGEVCAAAHCSALSCNDIWYATDPATGACTPLSGCVDPASVAGWAPCTDPCAGLGENACLQDQRCQATYAGSVAGGGGTAGSGGGVPATPVRCAPGTSCGGSADGVFRSCQPVAAVVDPCAALDGSRCTSDPRCEILPTAGGCFCESGPDGGACDCGATPPSQPVCHQKLCDELKSAAECNARQDCSTTPLVESAGTAGAGTTTPVPSSSTATPKSEPFAGCFPLGGCFGADEKGCRAQRSCRPIYDGAGKFAACEAQDFTRHCVTASDCNAGERCNAAGACVVQGCAGENEAECNADPTCEPIYALQCSPYANGGGGGGFPGGELGACGAGAAPIGGCQCEPSFSGCQAHGPGCDPGKSVMVRDPAILDDPFWSFSRVLAAVTGANADDVADAWLPTLGADTTVGGKLAAGRPGAAAFIAALPRTSAGKIDTSQIGFVPTSLSNRLDLADGASCGEARITYALSLGATDRRHRMTVIIELRQPYDGAGCRLTARTWFALSTLDGAALQSALQSIYTPLLTPANLKQIRTNEFLVGPQTAPTPSVWELREFHVGSDARLHQSLLPLQIDQAAASAADFTTWASANRDGLQKGTVTFPTQYQIPTATEDGSQLSLDPATGNLASFVNQATCAGCHTTATNSAFAHVAERRNPGWRAEISSFLEQQLQVRAQHLGAVAFGQANAVLDVRPMH